MTEQQLLDFVNKNTWKEAKTYAKFAPHEYLLSINFKGVERGEFDAFIEHINFKGKPEKFYSRTFKYIYLGDYKYWIDHAPNTLILNRALSKYKYENIQQ